MPIEKPRFFIENNIDLGGESDCMYIKATTEDYDRWHAENQRDYRRRQAENDVKILPLEYQSQRDEQGSLCGKLTDGVDWEMVAIEDVDMDALAGVLKKWRSWAVDLTIWMDRSGAVLSKLVNGTGLRNRQ